MTDLIETVAKAICRTVPGTGNVDEHFIEKMYPRTRSMWLDIARAAITAMREPTEAMIDAGLDEDGGGHDDPANRAIQARAFTAMIDAALAPAPPEAKVQP